MKLLLSGKDTYFCGLSLTSIAFYKRCKTVFFDRIERLAAKVPENCWVEIRRSHAELLKHSSFLSLKTGGKGLLTTSNRHIFQKYNHKKEAGGILARVLQ